MAQKELSHFASIDRDSASKLRPLLFSHITISLKRDAEDSHRREDIIFLQEYPKLAGFIKHLTIQGRQAKKESAKYSRLTTAMGVKILELCPKVIFLLVNAVRWRSPRLKTCPIPPFFAKHLRTIHFESITCEGASPFEMLSLNTSWMQVTTRNCDLNLFFIPLPIQIKPTFTIGALHIGSVFGNTPIYPDLHTKSSWIQSIPIHHLDITLDGQPIPAARELLQTMSGQLYSVKICQWDQHDCEWSYYNEGKL